MVSNTPIWLELKPSFIDENFDKVLHYLSSTSTEHDNFYQETLLLLEKRVRLAIQQIQSAPLYVEDDVISSQQTVALRDADALLARMMMTFLMVSQSDNDLRPMAEAALYYYLIRLDPQNAEHLVQCQIQQLTHTFSDSLPLFWSDISQPQFQVLIHRIINTHRAIQSDSTIEYSGCGCAITDKGHLLLCPDKKTMQAYLISHPAASVSLLNDHILLHADKDHRLKQSDQNNFDKLEEFAACMISLQKPVTTAAVVHHYNQGDQMDVVVLSAAGGQMRVRTIDQSYAIIEGSVDFDWSRHKNSLTYDYRSADFCSAMKPGDIFLAQLDDPIKGVFSIYEPFLDCHNDDPEVGAISMVDQSTDAYAAGVWRDMNTNTDRVRWISREGYVMQSFWEEGIQEGMYAYVHIDSVKNGFVNVSVLPDAPTPFDIDGAKRNCIESFSHDHNDSLLRPKRVIQDAELRMLYGSLYMCQRQMNDVYQRGMCLCVIRVLSTMIAANEDSHYAAFLMSYLNNLVRFATHRGDLTAISTELQSVPCVHTRLAVLDILRATGTETGSDYLQQLQDDAATDPLLLKLARLAEAYNHLMPVTGEKTLGFIRREMVASLSIASEENADLEENGGLFLGDESSTTEYKTSFIYPPDNNMQPDEERQKRNVMRGLCAFMNSRLGGTLYLGITDAGKVVGVEQDKHYLKIYTMDSYIRHLQDAIKPFFPSEYQCLDFSQQYDGKAVAIHVQPYKYGVAKLEGVAYHRWGNENRPMSQSAIEQLWNERQFRDEKKVRSILTLITAIEQHKRAILHGYHSNNSQTISDRLVEPFCFSNDYHSVWCYDCDKQLVRVFAVSRIGNAELTSADWMCRDQHCKLDEDIFRMSGTEKTHVVLQLDMMAYNLLIEEYPASVAYLHLIEGLEPVQWILDTEVCSMAGIGRFCMGLLSNIQILDGEPLQQYLRKQLTDGLALVPCSELSEKK